LGSKYIGADMVFAYPGAEIVSVAPKTAAGIIFRKEMQKAVDPQKEEKRLVSEYYDKFVNPYNAASWQHIDDIIEPKDTRRVIVSSLEMLKGKKVLRPWKKHGNIPL
jgi:propionyl-CoA carboxylase beta chain